MKSIGGGLYVRGVQRTLYLRKRTPLYLCRAYPAGHTHCIVCLKTSGVREGRKRAIFEQARLEAEFEQKRVELTYKECPPALSGFGRCRTPNSRASRGCGPIRF